MICMKQEQMVISDSESESSSSTAHRLLKVKREGGGSVKRPSVESELQLLQRNIMKYDRDLPKLQEAAESAKGTKQAFMIKEAEIQK